MYCNWYCEKYLRTPLLTYTFYFDLLETFDYLILPHFYNGRILISNNKGIMEKLIESAPIQIYFFFE